MKSLKKTALVALAACALCGSVWAAPEAEQGTAQEDGKTVLHGQIVGFEAGQIWVVEQPNGARVRADLGKHGGRLWRLKDMDFYGWLIRDERGLLFKMDKVEFEDPAVDERRPRRGDGDGMISSKKQDDRDVAFYYPDQVPTDNKSYVTQNLQGVQDLSVYSSITANQLAGQNAEAKVVIKGRPIRTIIKDKEMLFWDEHNQPYRVVMNGGFIPLGQRCFTYGTVTKTRNGLTRLQLDMVESVQ